MFRVISAFVIIWPLVDVPPLVSSLRKNGLFKMLKMASNHIRISAGAILASKVS